MWQLCPVTESFMTHKTTQKTILTRDQENQESGFQLYMRLLRYVHSYWYLFIVSFVCFGIAGGTQAWAANWLKEVVDAVQKQHFDQRGWLSASIVGIYFLRGIVALVGSYSLTMVARAVVHRMRVDVFDQVLSLPGTVFQQMPSGELLAKLTYNIEQVTGAVTSAIKTILREGLTVVGLLGYLLYLNWKLTLIFLLAAPLLAVVIRFASMRIRMLSKRLQKSVSDINVSAHETIRGYQVVRIFGGAEQERERFTKASDRNRRQVMKMVVTQSLYTPTVQLILAAIIGGLLYVAMSPSIMGMMSTGSFVAFLTAAGMITKPIRQLTGISSTIQRGIAAAESVFEVVDYPPEPDEGTQSAEGIKGELQFEHLSFTYPGAENPALNDITLNVPAGKSMALVGKSGSGKSTMAGLLPRFNVPWQGKLLLDGVPLEDYQLASLREQIALVNQDIILFDGTLAENIAYGSMRHATREQIMAAAEAAHVTEFLDRLPDGLDTQLGVDGSTLSGGQKQRVAIARAILKDAPILIFDEATSALDTESERHIQDALESVMQNRTTIVIAHRLSTIENADKIVVMDAGRIVEEGSHQELIERQGAYARLHDMQFHDEAKGES